MARRAPSTSADSFAQTISVGTSGGWLATRFEAKPQSVPASTFSRPTTSARRQMRSATEIGMFDDDGSVRDDAGHQLLAVGKLDITPDAAIRVHGADWPFQMNKIRR